MFGVKPTIIINGQHYRRRKFGPSVTDAIAHYFKGEDAMQGIRLRQRDKIAMLAFCFLDDLGRRQFDYSPAKFEAAAFRKITDEGLDAVCLQLDEIINAESAAAVEGGEKLPDDPAQKKNVYIGLALVACAILGITSLFGTLFRAVFP